MSPVTLQCQSCSGSLGALLSALTQENGSDGRNGCLFNVSLAQMEASRQAIRLHTRLSSQSLGRALKALKRNGESQKKKNHAGNESQPVFSATQTNACVQHVRRKAHARVEESAVFHCHFFHIGTFSSAAQIDFEAFCFGPLVTTDSSECLSLSLFQFPQQATALIQNH